MFSKLRGVGSYYGVGVAHSRLLVTTFGLFVSIGCRGTDFTRLKGVLKVSGTKVFGCCGGGRRLFVTMISGF